MNQQYEQLLKSAYKMSLLKSQYIYYTNAMLLTVLLFLFTRSVKPSDSKMISLSLSSSMFSRTSFFWYLSLYFRTRTSSTGVKSEYQVMLSSLFTDTLAVKVFMLFFIRNDDEQLVHFNIAESWRNGTLLLHVTNCSRRRSRRLKSYDTRSHS